jgi:hypothetical protein
MSLADEIDGIVARLGGTATTLQVREQLAERGYSAESIGYAIHNLSRTGRVTTNWQRGRPPREGWTITRTGKTRQPVNDHGTPRIVLEFLALRGGHIDSLTWDLFRKRGITAVNSKNALKSLMAWGAVEKLPGGIAMTDRGRDALEMAREKNEEVRGLDEVLERYRVARAAWDRRREVERARLLARRKPLPAELIDEPEPEDDFGDIHEKRWAATMKGRRYEDIPAHLIRRLPVLRWSRRAPERSEVGNAAAMCAESRSAQGGQR